MIIRSHPFLNQGLLPPQALGAISPAVLARFAAGLEAKAAGNAAALPSLDFSGVPILDQGSQNSCGTTSLAMIFDFYGLDVSQAQIDREIRRTNLWGTAPTDLVEFARSQGLSAGMYNRSTVDELKGHLAAGRPVMVSIDDPYDNGSDGGFKEHYVIVTGFRKAADGTEEVLIRDPNGFDSVMPLAKFEEKWGKTIDGYDNFMLVFGAPGERLPADRTDGLEHSLNIAESYRALVNNFDRLFSPEDFPTFARGLLTAPALIVPGLVTGVGWGISFLGKGLQDLAQDFPPVLRELGLIVGGLIDAPGRFLTEVGAGFAGGIDQIGGGFEKLFRGDVGGFFEGLGGGLYRMGSGVVKGALGFVESAGSGLLEAGKSVVDGVKSVGKSIASGVKKIFSGW